MHPTFDTRSLEPFGQEVRCDLGGPLSTLQHAELRRLLAEHSLLLFRRQRLDMDAQVRLAKRFGNVVSVNGRTVGEYISNVRPDGALGAAEICFHSDLSFSRYPYEAVLMHAVDVVDEASSTRFASGVLAYDRLGAAVQDQLLGLQALLVWPLDPSGRNRDATVPPHYPRAVQPLVWTHPLTGRRSIYCDFNATDRILGLAEAESEALLDSIWREELGTACVYEHRWCVGDVVLWDNMALLHARGDVSNVGARTLQRVTIAEKGYADIFPQVDVGNSIGKQDPVIPRERLSQLP